MLRVEVRWVDSGTAYENGWESREAILRAVKLHEISSVGWLMAEDDFAYVIATTRDVENNQFFGVQVIAKSSVIDVTRLRARTTREDSLASEEDEG